MKFPSDFKFSNFFAGNRNLKREIEVTLHYVIVYLTMLISAPTARS